MCSHPGFLISVFIKSLNTWIQLGIQRIYRKAYKFFEIK